MELSEQIKGIQKFFEPEVEGEDGDADPGDNIVNTNSSNYSKIRLIN